MSIEASFERNGFVVLRQVMDGALIRSSLEILRMEYQRRQIEGESEDDRVQARTRLHYMASFEKSPAMDSLLEEVVKRTRAVFPVSWCAENRQIYYRNNEVEVDPCPYHIDGCSQIFNRNWEEVWPGFQILAGVPMMEIAGIGQGGLFVRPGSHLRAIEIYNAEPSHVGGLRALQAWEKEQKLSDDGILLSAKPGDLVLCHSLTLHKPHPEMSTQALDTYFRLNDGKIVGRRALGEVRSF